MIIPDVNLLVYAYSRGAPHHDAARAWWEGLLGGRRGVGVPWATALGFVRLMTHPRVMETPVAPAVALSWVHAWLAQPSVDVLEPGPRHLDLLDEMLAAAGTGGNLTTDAHLAAIAVEHQAELHSNDTDFARFPGLRWRDPLR